MDRIRIFLTGVGGQGTLTATTLLASTALAQGMPVVSGEIHGMAQRGGVVESAVLIGGYTSPRVNHGEADIILGFEPLETIRALPYLAPGGLVLSSSDAIPPVSVSSGGESYPELEYIRETVNKLAKQSWFVPCRELGTRAGSSQSGNTALLGAACAAGVLPFGLEALEAAIRKFLPAKVVEVNLKALALGAEAVKA
jgi:indolepyruvate ferredoxin oxidoreductase beta subunit